MNKGTRELDVGSENNGKGSRIVYVNEEKTVTNQHRGN